MPFLSSVDTGAFIFLQKLRQPAGSRDERERTLKRSDLSQHSAPPPSLCPVLAFAALSSPGASVGLGFEMNRKMC